MAEHEQDLRVNTLIRLLSTVQLSDDRYQTLLRVFEHWLAFDHLNPKPDPPEDPETIADLEAWGADMSMTETGATNELRERIAKGMWESYTGYVTRIPWDQAGSYKQTGHLRMADVAIAEIIPPDQAMVGREDLRAIVAYVLAIKGPDDFSMFHEASIALTPDVLDRLAAALEPRENGDDHA